MASVEDLKTYELQLQQVEAALTTDPENEELLKLKKDLQHDKRSQGRIHVVLVNKQPPREVIHLTTELLSVPAVSSKSSGNPLTPSSSSTGSAGSRSAGDAQAADFVPEWTVGDKCMALWDEDGQYYEAVIEEVLEDGTFTITYTRYYEAVIEEVLEDGTFTITYTGWNNSAVCSALHLKSLDPSLKRGANGERGIDAKKSKKDLMAEQREYKRKKALKKAQRMKQLEEEHEQDKNKWLDFNHKTFSKTSKGKVKKSIFATPDSVSGKVGVGTCGSGGRPMTSYQHQEKWKK